MTHQELTLNEIGALKSKALSFPKSLRDARKIAADLAKRVDDLKNDIKDAEQEELLAASMKTNGDAKPLYSNDTQRKAAAAQALAQSPTHRERLKRLADAETDLLNARLDAQRVEDEHKSYQEIVKLVVAEVDLLTAWMK